MSDHIDGPRSIGDPSIDLTDLFAFTSPENPGRTVLAAGCVSLGGRQRDVFQRRQSRDRGSPGDRGRPWRRREVQDGRPRSFASAAGSTPSSRGPTARRRSSAAPAPALTGRYCTLSSMTKKGLRPRTECFASLRASLRSVLLAWLVDDDEEVSQSAAARQCALHRHRIRHAPRARPRQRLAVRRHRRDHPAAHSPADLVGPPPPRFDWVGRPEQTNMRLNNPALAGTDDLRDLWNQQTPFAIDEDLRPLFRKRLMDSLTNWDMRDGKADWTPPALAASANVFLDDFLLFDVSKPITDTSFLEIEKSTLDGHAYQTGGGRTVNANVIDILLTWMVNHDQGNSCRAARRRHQAGPQDVSLSGSAEHAVADRGGQRRPGGAAGAGLGAHRGVRRHVASIDRQDPADRRRVSGNCARSRRSTASRSSNGSRRSTSRNDSIATACQRHPGRGLHGNVGRQAEGRRQLRRVARAVSGGWPARHCHEDHRFRRCLKRGSTA